MTARQAARRLNVVGSGPSMPSPNALHARVRADRRSFARYAGFLRDARRCNASPRNGPRFSRGGARSRLAGHITRASLRDGAQRRRERHAGAGGLPALSRMDVAQRTGSRVRRLACGFQPQRRDGRAPACSDSTFTACMRRSRPCSRTSIRSIRRRRLAPARVTAASSISATRPGLRLCGDAWCGIVRRRGRRSADRPAPARQLARMRCGPSTCGRAGMKASCPKRGRSTL